MTEALALAGALDEAGDVGDHVLVAVGGAHDAEMGLERGERVVGDLGLGGRDAADQRRLAHVGEPDQRHVGQQLELEAQPPLLADLALLGERRGPAAVGQELGVAAAAPPALGGDVAVAGRHEVGEHGALAVAHHGPLGHGDEHVGAARAVAALAHAVGAVVGPAERLVLERQQRRHVVVGDQHDVAPAAPVASVGPALGHVRLTTEGHRAGAPVARLHVQVALVDELGHCARVCRCSAAVAKQRDTLLDIRLVNCRPAACWGPGGRGSGRGSTSPPPGEARAATGMADERTGSRP